MLLDGLPWRQDDYQDQVLLGWVAYAYDKRTSLNAPVGLIYSQLKQKHRPSSRYMDKPEEFLPEEFCETLGLIEYECAHCPERFSTRVDLNTHEQSEHPYRCLECNATFKIADEERVHYKKEHHPDRVRENDSSTFSMPCDETVNQRLNDGLTMSPAQAWQSVLGQLQMEMPRASFDTWVRDAVAIHFEDDVLQIAVLNSYARDWLENRLTSTIERLLVGIMNRSVSIEFVVADISRK